MKIPRDVPFFIIKYRDFFDMPRLILAQDDSGKFWIFDSRFNEAEDEYSSNYYIFPLGENIESAIETYNMWGSSIDIVCSTIPASCLTFDETRRKSFVISGAE